MAPGAGDLLEIERTRYVLVHGGKKQEKKKNNEE